MPGLTITVQHQAGLHLRPAAMFVQKAASYTSTIKVRNVTTDKGFQNAKSIMSVTLLGVKQGHAVEITAEGDDADQALAGLKELIESNFGE